MFNAYRAPVLHDHAHLSGHAAQEVVLLHHGGAVVLGLQYKSSTRKSISGTSYKES